VRKGRDGDVAGDDTVEICLAMELRDAGMRRAARGDGAEETVTLARGRTNMLGLRGGARGNGNGEREQAEDEEDEDGERGEGRRAHFESLPMGRPERAADPLSPRRRY